MNKKIKYIAIGAAIGLGVGVAVGAALIIANSHILKEAKWTPDGDMLMSFYNHANDILIHKPE